MRKRLVVALLVATSWPLVLASCGSETSSDVPTTTDAGVDGSGPTPSADTSPNDASQDASLRDGGTGCPASTPAEWSPCPEPALQCEYGNFEFADCNSTATCTTKGWSIAPPPITTCAPNNTFCPATSADIHNGDACPSSMTCFYPDITCACTAKGSADGGATWSCDDGPAECPAPRPHLGTPCTEEGQICDYASCGKGGTTVRNMQQTCKSGVWRFVFSKCDGG